MQTWNWKHHSLCGSTLVEFSDIKGKLFCLQKCTVFVISKIWVCEKWTILQCLPVNVRNSFQTLLYIMFRIMTCFLKSNNTSCYSIKPCPVPLLCFYFLVFLFYMMNTVNKSINMLMMLLIPNELMYSAKLGLFFCLCFWANKVFSTLDWV